jgi:hypothetical protein
VNGSVNQRRTDIDAERARFRRTLAKVMTTQVVALLVLWLLQTAYAP